MEKKPALKIEKTTIRNLTNLTDAVLAQVNGGMMSNYSTHINQHSKGTCCCGTDGGTP